MIIIKEQQNDIITITKAIAIMLMVLAHAGFYHLGSSYISMFHMPLFFICSGYCFKDKYIYEFNVYARKKVKGIWLPFVKYGLLFLLLHNLFFKLNIYNSSFGYRGAGSSLYSLKEIAVKALNLTRMYDAEQLLGGFWFLKVLFVSSFISYIVFKLSKCNNKKLAIGGEYC